MGPSAPSTWIAALSMTGFFGCANPESGEMTCTEEGGMEVCDDGSFCFEGPLTEGSVCEATEDELHCFTDDGEDANADGVERSAIDSYNDSFDLPCSCLHQDECRACTMADGGLEVSDACFRCSLCFFPKPSPVCVAYWCSQCLANEL
jgi:hypothetical protein